MKIVILQHEILRFEGSKVMIFQNLRDCILGPNSTDFDGHGLVLKRISFSVVSSTVIKLIKC